MFSQHSQEKNLNDADSFDDCQPSLSKLENHHPQTGFSSPEGQSR